MNEIPHSSQKQLVEKMKMYRRAPFSLKSIRLKKPSEYQASEEAGVPQAAAAAKPATPTTDVHVPATKAKRPNKLHNKLVKGESLCPWDIVTNLLANLMKKVIIIEP